MKVTTFKITFYFFFFNYLEIKINFFKQFFTINNLIIFYKQTFYVIFRINESLRKECPLNIRDIPEKNVLNFLNYCSNKNV